MSVPIGTTALLAWLFFVPLPMADYWDVLASGQHALRSGLGSLLEFASEPFVDQVMFFPKLSINCLAAWTHCQHYGIEIAAGFAAQIVMLLILRRMIRNSRLGPEAGAALWVAAGFLLFWPAQLVRFQHHWYSTQYSWVLLFGLLGILILQGSWGQWRGLIPAMGCCLISALSHGTGAVLMPMVALSLLLAGGWSRLQAATWAISTAVLLLVLLNVAPGRGQVGLPPFLESLSDPVHALSFFVRCLGPPIQRLLFGGGLLVLGLAAVWTLSRSGGLWNREAFPWIAIFLWSLACAGVTTLARAQMYNKPPRIYYSFFVLFGIAVLSILVLAARTSSTWRDQAQRLLRNRWVLLLPGLILAFFYIRASAKEIRSAGEHQVRVKRSARILRFAPVLHTADVRPLFPNERFLTSILPKLASLGYLPGETDLRPFRKRIPTDMELLKAEGLEATLRGQGIAFTFSGASCSLDVALTPGVLRAEVFSMGIELPPNVAAECLWDDGRGFSLTRHIALTGRSVAGRVRIFFDEGPDPAPVQRPVHRLRFLFRAPVAGAFSGRIHDPEILRR